MHLASLAIQLKLWFTRYNTDYFVLVLVAPIKALCSQRFDDWKEKFGPIGLSCKELTGDTMVDDLFEIHHADIIITTPVGFSLNSYQN